MPFAFNTICDGENIQAAILTASYTGVYSEKDFITHPCFSFPLYAAFEYKSGHFQQVLDSNAVLLETKPLEFEVFKFKEFQQDATLCIFLKTIQVPDLFCENKLEPVLTMRRSPREMFLIENILQFIKNKHFKYIEQSVFQLLDALFAHPDRPTYLPINRLPFTIQRIDTAKAFIHAHFADTIGITDIAGAGHLSPFHFSRLFKKYTGYTPYDYLLFVRIEQAKARLTANADVTETAFNTGFNSLENFSYTFKKMTGLSPSQFQKSKISKVYLQMV